ncbi:MAG: outer membrane protein assembly factor BamA [Aquificae bacterium]|nr:outer membrane protein assembly factor BamA [Aquificota bacterium]
MGQEVISSVKVEGNRFVADEEVLKLLGLEPGVLYSPDLIYSAVKRAYLQGAFEFIAVYRSETPEGVALLVKVKDLPVVYDVEFVGNRKIKDEDLRRILGIPENPQELAEEQTAYISGPAVEEKLQIQRMVPIGRPLTLKEIEEMARQIELYYAYKGYPGTKVRYEIVPVKGASKLVFRIEEGREKWVSDIRIEGLKTLDEDEVKSVMELKEPNWLLFRFHPPFSEELLRYDAENIEKFLKEKGYFEGRVVSYNATTEKDGATTVVIRVHEGPRYKVSKVEISGNTYFGYAELTEKFFKKLKKEKGYYDQKLVDLLKEEILQKYRNLGLYFTRVLVRPEPDPQTKTVKLVVVVEESRPVYNRWTEVRGNYETRDYVIRRELELHEGDLVTEEKVRWSKIWLNRLGYFAGTEVSVEPLEGSYAKTTVKVTERFTGQFSVGIGYSETSGLSGFVSLRKGNFLGTGDIVGLTLSFGEYAKNYSFSYTRKWFMNRPQDLSFKVYQSENDYETYDVKYAGFSTTLTRRFWHYWRWHVGLDLQSIDYDNVSPDASVYVKEAAQFNSATIIRWGVARDTRNSYLFPSDGSYLAFNERFGGLLGGDAKFAKVWVVGSIHRKDEWFDSGTIVNLKGQVGAVGPWGGENVVPIDERFFVGGDFTIRGYKYGYAGPLDPNTGDPIGATKMWVVNFEVDYPVKENLFYLAAFADAGNGFNQWADAFQSVKAGAGFGIRFVTPMAPIRLDFAWKLKKVPGDTDNFRIHLILGSFF